MAEHLSVRPSDLVLDAQNPRLSEPNNGQRDVLRSIAKQQNRKLLSLAKDILQSGLDPSSLMIVIPHEADRRYVVVEGNRRLAALRVLENPELVSGAIDDNVLATFRELSQAYQDNPIQTVECVQFKSREEANHWIELRHTGERDGVGVVKWGTHEQDRFKSRSGSQPLHVQVLDFLEQAGKLDAALRQRVPATTLMRVLSSPAVRSKLGIDLENGELKIVGHAKKVAAALLYVLNDLASGKTKVGDVYKKDQRTAYANAIPKKIVVPARGDKAVAPPTKSPPTKSVRVASKERPYLIPRDCVMAITEPRVRDVENELRGLNYLEFPNACAVLLRVFIELSLDAFMNREKMPWSDNMRLKEKMDATLKHLLNSQKLTSHQAVPVNKAASGSMLAPSITLMNKYVHHFGVVPTPQELRATWIGLQPFIVAQWSP